MMTIHKFLSTTVVICGILSVTGPSAVAAKDVADEKALQRRRDLKERGPMSKEDADFLRKLMSKNTVRLGRKDNAEAFSNIGNNPFMKAVRGNNRKNRGRHLLGNRNGILQGDIEPKIGAGDGFGNKQDAEPADTTTTTTTTTNTTRSGHEPDVPPPTKSETETDEISEIFEASTSTKGTRTQHHDKTERGGNNDNRSKKDSKKSNGGYDE
jgi:hypothetical protein